MRVRLNYGVHANMSVYAYVNVNVLFRSVSALRVVLGDEVLSSLRQTAGHVQLEACWKTIIGNMSPRRASFEPMAMRTDPTLLSKQHGGIGIAIGPM